MRRYLNKPIEELAAQLTAGLLRLRKGYVDAAEALIHIIDPATAYPYEFVVYRLTGYRPPPTRGTAQLITGQSLRRDLQQLALDLCDSFTLRAADYAQNALDVPAITRRFNISAKTVQRWQRENLFGRRLVMQNGKRRLAFLESSIQWFLRDRQRQVLRSMKFSQLTASQRNDIIRRAQRMARFTHCTLSEVARRLAQRTGRAVETIRYTIRKYDCEHPESSIFAYLTGPLSRHDREVIYRCFLSGVSAPELARKYRRTRGSVYRIISEMRAEQLRSRPIEYIYNPQFDLPNADEIIEPAPIAAAPAATAPSKLGETHDGAYFKELYRVPLLEPARERDLFRCYNYLKYKADKLRRQINLNRVRTGQLKQVESLLLKANLVQNQIIRANLRLVVSIARKHVGSSQTLLELISDGNVSLIHAVEKFDYSRGYRFSTYASWAIMRNFARSVPQQRYQLDRFLTIKDEVLDIAAGLRSYDPNEVNLGELRESLDALLARLTPRERTILMDHYGLDKDGRSTTFDQLGQKLGISKERVRQIEMKALDKLRGIMQSPS